MAFLGFFRKAVLPAHSAPGIDVRSLEYSFQLLQTTTAEVTSEAAKAARVLKDRLDQSEDRFYNTIDSVDDLVLIKDGEGRWLTLNTFGQQLFGMKHGEFWKKTSEELGGEFPRLAETFTSCEVSDQLAWEAGVSSRTEEQIPHGAGNRYFDIVKTPTYNDDGTKKELIVVGRDVTDLREKQKRTKACFTALNSASEPIAILDDHGRVFFCNDQFVDTFDLVSYEEATGKKLQDVIACIKDFNVMWDQVQLNKPWHFQCYHESCSDQCSKNTNLTIIPMMNGAPKPVYYICTFKRA